jgi:dihydrofolate synthase/folylpolyglutamate synthase
MKIKEAISWLEGKQRYKIKTDLSKMRKALNIMGNPEKDFKAIHITGTNGKGSVAHTISKVLSKVKKVGLFTSPYVTRFNERLQINDEEIDDDVLLNYIIWAKEFDEKYLKEYDDNFSFFELLTLIMIKYFSDEKVDYAVIEVGIGGRLDSTNVIDADYAVITSIGLDHTKQLGDTLEKILKEKLEIAKENKKLFTAVDSLLKVILDYCISKNIELYLVSDNDYELIDKYPLTFKYEGEVYQTNLQGLYQVKNTILAVEVLKQIIDDVELIKEGVFEVVNPGRFEVISKEPYIILDGAHNYEAIMKLGESITEIFGDKNIKVLYASMEDKPYIKMVERLRMLTDEVYLTSINYPRALKDFSADIFKGLEVFPDPLEGFFKLKNFLEKDEVLVVTGSIYLVSLIRNELLSKK